MTIKDHPYQFAQALLNEVTELVASKRVPRIRGEATHWTHAVKCWLDSEGKRTNPQYRSIYNGPGGGSEFMLDFVWWDDGEGKSTLGCEMEWGNTRDPKHNVGRVAEDFDKLLSFKSEVKLMLFDSYGDVETRADVVKELSSYVRDRGDHIEGEYYLVMDVSGDKDSVWECRILRNGRDKSLSFLSLTSS